MIKNIIITSLCAIVAYQANLIDMSPVALVFTVSLGTAMGIVLHNKTRGEKI